MWAGLRREWRMLAGVATAVCGGLALSVYVYGIESHLSYVRVLTFISARGEAYFPNQSMNGLLNRWVGNGSNLHFERDAFSAVNGFVSAGSTITAMVLF